MIHIIKPLLVAKTIKYSRRGMIGRHDRYISRWNKIYLNRIRLENEQMRRRHVLALQRRLQQYYKSI